ncbi:MAG: hypothetical protein O3A01_02945 [bacterium]|nr:hypothetical protein [bacterium]
MAHLIQPSELQFHHSLATRTGTSRPVAPVMSTIQFNIEQLLGQLAPTQSQPIMLSEQLILLGTSLTQALSHPTPVPDEILMGIEQLATLLSTLSDHTSQQALYQNAFVSGWSRARCAKMEVTDNALTIDFNANTTQSQHVWVDYFKECLLYATAKNGASSTPSSTAQLTLPLPPALTLTSTAFPITINTLICMRAQVVPYEPMVAAPKLQPDEEAEIQRQRDENLRVRLASERAAAEIANALTGEDL